MNLFLAHHPEGDHNPYEPAPWSRTPLTPAASDFVRVGVRVTGPVDQVAVEWANGDDILTTLLRQEAEDLWETTIGPFPASTRYRFVANTGEATDWFQLPVIRWSDGEFVGVRRSADEVVAGLDSGACLRLRLSETEVDWTVDAVAGDAGPDRQAKVGSWALSVEAGALHLASPAGELVVAAIAVGWIDEAVAATRLYWRLEEGEALFGGGERFNRLNQRGLTPDVRVYEQYKNQGDRSYFPLPWILSSRGYGLHVHSSERVAFDLGFSDPNLATVTIPNDSSVSGRWYLGAPNEIVCAYTAEVGRPNPLPVWAYGPWMSANEWDRDSRVREEVERTRDEQIPATVVVIEAWSDETTFYLFNDTTYDPVGGDQPIPAESMRHSGRWPDPKKLVEWLHGQEIRVILWQIPVLKVATGSSQHDADVIHAEDSGYCVQTASGEPYRNRGWWFPEAQVIDFTNPAARDWWFSKRAYLVEAFGVDGFKTDGGEHLWGSDVVTAVGERGDVAANRYPTHYLAAYHQFLTEVGHTRPVTFSRAGFTGSQAYPAHWAGDEGSTWEAYRASLVAGLSAGLSGVVFWSWDLAGFAGPLPDAELYKRAAGLAALCPVMQYHSEYNQHRTPRADRTPWNVADQTGDPTVLDIYRFYARLRMNLIPYLHQAGLEASETGNPLMRALVLDFPQDPEAVGIDDQFLLGSHLLVAPILHPGVDSRAVYIPTGAWYDLWTATPVDPGRVTAPAPVDRIPIYVRAGVAVPLWLSDLELGSPVGLPGSGSGRMVVMVLPGTHITRLVDPITEQGWKVETRVEGTTLHISVTDAPPELTIWVRIPDGRDHTRVLPEGASTLRVELGSG